MSKKEKTIVTVTEHTWLDCSKSWYIKINGITSGGEIDSEDVAVAQAQALARSIGATFEAGVHTSNAMFTYTGR